MTYGWLGTQCAFAFESISFTPLNQSLRSRKEPTCPVGRAARLNLRRGTHKAKPVLPCFLAPLAFPVSLASIGRHCASVLVRPTISTKQYEAFEFLKGTRKEL